jgi:hypothetical protein
MRGDRAPEQQTGRGGSDVAPFVFHGAQTMVTSQNYEALRKRALIAGEMFQLMLELHALRASLKYNADQPRAPAGQPDGGRWVGVGEAGNAGSDHDGKVVLAGNLEKLDPSINIGQFISDNCQGKIRREMPGQFYGMTIGEMLGLRRAGDRAADTCYKLLDRGKFRK